MDIIIMIIVWFLLAMLIAKWANIWGRRWGTYFIGSLLCSPILSALSLLLEGKDVKKTEEQELESNSKKKCPFCAELIRKEATKCRYCGSELEKKSSE